MSFVFREKEYHSFSNCCNRLGLKANSIYVYAKRHNVTPKEALELVLSSGFFFRGIKYYSLAECCKAFKVSSGTIRKYEKQYNMSTQEALEYCLSGERTNRYTFEFRGVKYKGFKECCEKLGFKYVTVRAYIKKNNVSRIDALEYYLNPVKPPKYRFEFRGTKYKDFKTCCKELGLNHNTIYTYRRTHGGTRQEALEHYLTRDDKPTKTPIFREKDYYG